MKFFADTVDIDAIKDLADLGMLDGVTTNPSIIVHIPIRWAFG